MRDWPTSWSPPRASEAGGGAGGPAVRGGTEEVVREDFDWPVERQVYLTLDFECDYGTPLESNVYEAVTHVGELVSLFERLDVPLTAFVQTELFEERSETVETLREAGVEVRFHPTHTRIGDATTPTPNATTSASAGR